MLVGEVEGVDRIRVDGQRRHILVHEGRGIGPCPPDRGAVQEQDRDRGTVAVQGIAGDTAGGRRPREGDPGGGAGRGRKTAHTAYQSVAEARVAVPCWPPAALEVMSSS